MRNKALTAYVTVTYKCPNFITESELAEYYDNDPLRCYKYVSDNFGDEPFNFGEMLEDSIKVEIK